MKDKNTLKWLFNSSKAQLPAVLLLTVMRSAATILGVTFALTSQVVIDAAVSHNMQ